MHLNSFARRLLVALLFAVHCFSLATMIGTAVEPISAAATWSLESVKDLDFELHGDVRAARGVQGRSIALNGLSVLVAPESSELLSNPHGFTMTIWLNPYALNRDQQMIVAKNRYSLGERQWGVMIDADNRIRLYLWQGKWVTAQSKSPPKVGRWHLVGVVVRPDEAELWVDGKLAGNVALQRPLANTKAPLTLGGINDNGHIRQTLFAALDEVKLFNRPLTHTEMAANYTPVTDVHELPKPPKPVLLWDVANEVQKIAETPTVPGVRFHVIKPYEFQKDGYRFLHGVGLAFHNGRLYASFGHNQGGENTDTEQARLTYSDDGGVTWSDVTTIDNGTEPGLGVSHGVFHAHDGQLWSFQGSYRGTLQKVHTRAYILDEPSGRWISKGTVIEGGFWPMQQPLKMGDGNWIMSGLRAGDGNPAAVAISHEDDFTRWQLVVIPRSSAVGKMWGESTVIVRGKSVLNICRYGAEAKALLATSEDYGRTWTESRPSNLPMATSKPYSGTLSTGQHYLICSTTADGGGRRSPLTIAVTRPGETLFSKTYVIRHAIFPDGPGESHEKAALSYPYAIEHDGHLFVGYSNNGGNVGRAGTGRELWNNNSAELAVIPVKNLRAD